MTRGRAVGSACVVLWAVAWSIAVSAATTEPAARLDRTKQSVFFDRTHHDVYAFGGEDRDRRVSNDLFVLHLDEPLRWHALRPSGETPPPRAYHAAGYCESRREFIIFGGATPRTGPTLERAPNWRLLADTWRLRLDGELRWERVVTRGQPPAARFGHAVIYDPNGDRLLVHGGRDSSDAMLDDLWELRLQGDPEWRRLELPEPRPHIMQGHVAVYDPRHKQLVMFGGAVSDHNLWSLPLATPDARWSSCPIDESGRATTKRMFAGAAFDSLGNGVAVFGGERVDGRGYSEPDLWIVAVGTRDEPLGKPSSMCSARAMTNSVTAKDGQAPIRPAPSPRTFNSLIVLPQKDTLAPGEEQPTVLVFAGEGTEGSNAAASVLGDMWAFYEQRPAGPGPWVRQWRHVTGGTLQLQARAASSPPVVRLALPREVAEQTTSILIGNLKTRWDIRETNWGDFSEELQTPEANDFVLHFSGNVFAKPKGSVAPELLDYMGWLRFKYERGAWRTGQGKIWIPGVQTIIEDDFFHVIRMPGGGVTETPHPADHLPEYIDSPYRRVLVEWLKAHPEFALVPYSHYPEGLSAYGLASLDEYKRTVGEPYYCTGDFNGDRIEDMAVGVIEVASPKQPRSMRIAIFNGPSPATYAEPTHLSAADLTPELPIHVDLNDGTLFAEYLGLMGVGTKFVWRNGRYEEVQLVD